MTKRGDGTGRLAALLVSPTLIVLVLVVGYPLVAALRESLYVASTQLDPDGFLVQASEFVGLRNYTDLAAAGRFWNAFWNTNFFMLVTVTLETTIGVLMALIMHKSFRGRGFVRASILVPWAIPTAVSGLLWRWIFNSDGVANAILGRQILWSTEGWQAKFAVIMADVWKTAPFIGLLVLAGLQIIPGEVYEAATVDGAGPFRRFFSITLPLVRPALVVAMLFRVLDALRMFDLPFVLIGPHKSSVEVLSMLAQDEAQNTRYGPAAAYAVILFVYLFLIALAFVKVLGADILGDAKERKPRAKKREVAVA